MHASIPPHHAALAHCLITLCLAASSLSACGDDTSNAATDGAATNNTTQPDPPTAWRYVLIEDQENVVAGEFPGVDIDAVELITADGTSHFATTVEDFNFGGGSARDPDQALGEMDSDCTATSGAFVALGGKEAEGYIMVGFSTPDQDVTFGKGSAIVIYELGEALCGLGAYVDAYTVSISASPDRSSFVQIGADNDFARFPVTIDP